MMIKNSQKIRMDNAYGGLYISNLKRKFEN
jgi:hypothetical protein